MLLLPRNRQGARRDVLGCVHGLETSGLVGTEYKVQETSKTRNEKKKAKERASSSCAWVVGWRMGEYRPLSPARVHERERDLRPPAPRFPAHLDGPQVPHTGSLPTRWST